MTMVLKYNNITKNPSEKFPVVLPGIIFIFFCLTISGCSFMVSSVSSDLAENLSDAILNNNDPATVETGGAAYLILIDSLLQGDPDNQSLLRTAANLYSAYTGVFVKDNERARRLTRKALGYGLRAVCARKPEACSLQEIKFQAFTETISKMDKDDVPVLYALGTAWAGWIQAERDDFNAVAQLSRVETIMQHIVKLDETYQEGGAHVYLGILATWLPPALGGQPETGRKHFERAVEISGNRNLMAKVMYARYYARLLFDQDLHDRLLHEVLEADPDVPGYTLINILAQKDAGQLLESGKDYF